MSKAEAHRLLDLVREGVVEESEETISFALAVTGDIGRHVPEGEGE